MKGTFRKTIVLIVVLVTTMALVPQVWAYRDWDSTPMEVDAWVLRPFGIAATVLGAAGFLVALPFAALTGTTEDAAQALVVAPYKFTFERPMGYPTTRYEDGSW
ncbi:MAG: hypothetical protein WHX93_15970 [bacterium]